MLKRLESLKGILRDPLYWKFAVTFLGYFFAIVNQLVPPPELAPLPESTNPYRDSSIKAGGFAFITAIALFALLIRTGTEQRDTLVDRVARLLGVLAAFGTAWYTLDVATQGNPGLYLYGAATLTGLAILVLLIGGGIWTAFVLVYSFVYDRVWAALEAAFLFVKTVVEYAIRFIFLKR